MFDAARAPLFRLDALLRRWGPLLLAIFAVCYYGQYYRSGLNLGGEGGTAAVIAMRLNEGWLPVRDTTLNYNVMWFYPVAWLFKITGPDYIALRIYFFALCLVAALLGFLVIRRVTNLGWLSLGVGLVIVMIPGMMFRNYMGLLTLLNTWAMLQAFVFDSRRRWLWFVVAGLVLGFTWLVRVEVGIFYVPIYLGLIALYPFGVRGAFRRRCLVGLGGGAVCLVVAVAIQAPFFADANARGFGREFVQSYLVKWDYVKSEALQKFRGGSQPQSAPKATPVPAAMNSAQPEWIEVRFHKTPKNWVELVQKEKAQSSGEARLGRQRESLRDIFKQDSLDDAIFVLILYLPLLISGITFVAAGCALAWAIFTANGPLKRPALVCLVALGSALTIFSQYFFFRPDTPHLSEFMVPFLVAMTCTSFYAFRLALTGRWPLRLVGMAFVVLCVVSETLYFYHSFRKESAGTIAAARKRSYEVVADNGVRVLVKRREQERLQALHDTIVRYAKPGEWVVTFPYSPTINFMTDRPSYLKDLYIDNATAGPHFQHDKAEEIEQFRPAVIVIDERDINDTEISRFKNWAAPTYDYIRRHYVRIGKDGDFDENEIYVRPDKVGPET